MQLSSIKSHLEMCAAVLQEVDFTTMSGADASKIVDALVPVARVVSATISAACARAVEGNQHTLHGFANGAEFVAAKLDVSMKDGRRLLAMQKLLSTLPSVNAAVRCGSLSWEKAAILLKEPAAADELLANAYKSVEELESLVQKIRARSGSQKQRRNTQYIHVRKDGDMIKGNFGVLASKASWMAEWVKIEQQAIRANRKSADPLPDTAAAAEAFSGMLAKSGGEAKNLVIYHVDIPLAPEGEASCELVGVGAVPPAVVDKIRAHAVLNVVLTVDDKLTRYYENVKPDPDRPLPDLVKRAVKASAYDRCEVDGCTQRAIDVDHIHARTNGGDHELHNLQALCKMHHDAKTKIDAPWTIPKYYARKRDELDIPEITIEDLPEVR
jgi:hypothetical protein